MDNKHRSLKVFLCHSHADRERVRALYFRLTKDGVDAWLDKEKLIPGQNWELEISKAVKDADVVVVCLSKQFNQSGYRQKEVRLALDTALKQPEDEIFIIPARLEECEPPDNLAKWEWVDLFDSNGYDRLMRALQARARKIGITLQMKKNLFQAALQAKRDELSSEKKQSDSKPQPTNEEPRKTNSKTSAGESKSLKRTEKHRPTTAISVALIGLIGTLIAGLLGSPILEKWLFSATPVIAQPSETMTQNPDPPATSAVSTNEVTAPAISATPALITVGADNMPLILIPAGEFQMGSSGNAADETPLHRVNLDSYFIDQTEVTNSMYAFCVSKEKCEPPRANTSVTQNAGNNSSYYGNSDFDHYPVVYVSWDDAKAYCNFVGRRLPTEAEWEKAASWDGTLGKKRIYPWGNSIDCSYANYYGGDNETLCVGDTTPVGAYPNGASFYDVLDMAGNVWEWVADRYDPEYYGDSPVLDPQGPPQGDYIVIRGGSFLVGKSHLRSSDREKMPPENTSHNVGFRCAMDAP